MKKLLLISAAVGSSAAVFALARELQPADAPTTMPAAGTAAMSPATQAAPTTQETLARVSYGFGYQIGQNMKQNEVQLDVTILSQGVTDAMGGTASKYSDADLQAAFEAAQTMMNEKMKAREAAAGAAGKAFLETNKAKPDVKTTASGLQYTITQEGNGPMPKPTDTVKVHYTGTLIDGTKFDSSIDRGEPAEFPLDGVIPGWTEGLQLLKVGGKARLFVPSDLAYGPSGRPPKIPGSATLIFDVELLAILPPTTAPAGAPETSPAVPPAVPPATPPMTPPATPQQP